jgi:hypothetical protein
MAKRLGLARTQALIENLKRELQMNQSVVVGDAHKVITVSATTKVLSADDSGAVVFLAGGSAATATLPTVQSGLKFTFIVTSAQQHIINGGATLMKGMVTAVRAAGPQVSQQKNSAGNQITFNSSAQIGDRVDVVCDGTNWYVSGMTEEPVTFAPT